MAEDKISAGSRPLVDRCRRGDRLAWRVVFERHYETIYRLLVSFTGDPSEAEDLLQECFLRAIRGIGRFRGEAELGTWLARIALNAFYDSRRHESVVRGLSQDTAAGSSGERPELPGMMEREAPDETLIRRERQQLVASGLRSLRKRDREVIVLRDIEGRSYAEIAALLQLAEGTVASRLSRARRRLQRAVQRLLAERNRRKESGARSSKARDGQDPLR